MIAFSKSCLMAEKKQPGKSLEKTFLLGVTENFLANECLIQLLICHLEIKIERCLNKTISNTSPAPVQGKDVFLKRPIV